MKYNEVSWDILIGFQGRCVSFPELLAQVKEGGRVEVGQALLNLELQLIQDNQVVIATPFVVHLLLDEVLRGSPNQGLLLRSISNYVRAIGFKWSLYYATIEQFAAKSYFDLQLDKASPYIFPFSQSESKDELLWMTKSDSILFADAWFYTREVLMYYKEKLSKLVCNDIIEQGILNDMMTILNMVKDQERNVFDLSTACSSGRLIFETLNETHWDSMVAGMTPEVTQYLSFDVDRKGILLREYIRQSNVEQLRGVNVVFAVCEKNSGEFIGSCGIYDINDEAVEFGLWIKKEAQGKGYGVEVVERLVQFVNDNIQTKRIIYSVELENIASLRIAERLGFLAVNDYLLEPTVLKNKIRHMRQFEKTLNDA